MSRRAPKTKKVPKVIQNPPPEPKKHSRKKEVSYGNWIKKLKTKEFAESRLSEDSCNQLDYVIQVLARSLSQDARNICVSSGRKTVSESDICLAVNLRFPEEMRDPVNKFIDDAIEAFKKSKNEDHTGPVRREVSAGLVFQVCLTEQFIRNFGFSSLDVKGFASISLTAALEYVAREILSVAVETTQNFKKVKILPRFMFLGISDHSGLNGLMEAYNIKFMDVGVVPFSEEEIKKIKDKKNQNRKKNKPRSRRADGKRSHNFRPGTVAIRDIKKYQKSEKPLLSKNPFKLTVKRIVNELDPENSIKFRRGTIEVIKSFVEENVTTLISYANKFTLHTGREGVKMEDIDAAWEFCYPWVHKTHQEATYERERKEEKTTVEVPLAQKRVVLLARRAGATRLRTDSKPIIRQFIHSLLTLILDRVIKLLRHQKLLTVRMKELQTSFNYLGTNYAILVPKKK